MKNMWEVEHSYYCSESNYYSNECNYKFKSWSDFIEEMGSSDMDYNLAFRWDWSESDPETGESTFNGDNYYRNGILYIFWMQQRKGRFTVTEIEVCRADQDAIKEYLLPRMAYLFGLWEPLTLGDEVEVTEVSQ